MERPAFPIKKIVFVGVFLLLNLGIFFNAGLLTLDTMLGNSYSHHMLVEPRHGMLRVPLNDLTVQYDAVNRLSGDFAQVYFPARANSSSAYTELSEDPWARPSRYAPFVHTVFAQTFCRLPYGYAAILHILVQLLLLYVSFFISFRAFGIQRWLFASLFFVNCLLFLTPTGLAWFERGQFSLYVALAYLWLILGLLKRRPFYIFLSAIFAYFKWTSFPFIAIAFGLWLFQELLFRRSIQSLSRSIALAAIFPLTVLMLLLSNASVSIEFIEGLFYQEHGFGADGLSIVHWVPHAVAKFLPLAFLCLGGFFIWHQKRQDFISLSPYLCAVGIFAIIYPTLAYDYSIPCLLGLLPVLVYWAERSRLAAERSHLIRIQQLRLTLSECALILFVSFLLVASVAYPVSQAWGLPEQSTLALYVLAILGLSSLAFWPAQAHRSSLDRSV